MIEKSEKKLSTYSKPAAKNEVVIENSLRPGNLTDYIGQNKLKRNLNIAVKAAQKRKDALGHILVYGGPGLGKTTLAHIIAKEMDVSIKITSGPALEKQGDLASILTNLKNNDILFIDEIHRLRPAIEELLYSAMEDFGLDIIIGEGPSAKSIRLSLPCFTLIGATTRLSLLSSPLRDRFENHYKVEFYEVVDLKEIIKRSSAILKYNINDDAAEKLAQSARCTPRIANRLLKQIRDYAEVHDKKTIELDIVEKALKNLGIDDLGLDSTDRDILSAIITKFDGGPVGVNTLAAATSEEEDTLETIYEPYLMKLGLLERTSRGRIATNSAYNHLELNKII